MTKHSGRALALGSALAILAGNAVAQTDPALREAASRYFQAMLAQSPTFATSIGDYRFNDKLEDVSDRGRAVWRQTLIDLQRSVDAINANALNREDALTYELLKRSLSDALLRLECLLYLTPLEPLEGPQIALPLLLVSQPFRNAADFRAYIARLNAFPAFMADHIANMRAGIAAGIVSPRVVIEKTVPQIRAHIVNDPLTSEFYTPAKRADVLAGQERAAVLAELETSVRERVVPAYRSLLEFVENEYLPKCRSTVGIGSVPGGKEIYEKVAYLHTTVRQPPAELHKMGLSEVARIRGEMAKIQERVGFKGTLDDFLQYMRTDPKFRFTSGEELVRAADTILQRAKSKMPELFGNLPKADCVMKEVEHFRAPSAPVAYYNPPPEDKSRPGYYYINTYAPNERLRFTLEALSYHEAVPGHHLQIALDQENTALPDFRRYATFTAYVEGWALYTEKLGYEIGGYRDPYDQFGQLTFEMWRACRLVVDTGMHLHGWTRAQAIDFMSANTSLARLDIESEIDRYISWPGQALAYKVGEVRISALRRDAEEALRGKFDVRAFHDALLANGAMPIELLEKQMRAWIESRRN